MRSHSNSDARAAISTRRRLLGILTGAGVVGAAGCVDLGLGSGGADAFEVTDLEIEPAEAISGGKITVIVSVENPSSNADTQTLELRISREVIASRDVSLEGNAADEVRFEGVELHGFNPGTHRIGVSSPGNEVEDQIEIIRPPQADELIGVGGTRDGVLELDTGEVEVVAFITNPFQFELGEVEATLHLPQEWEHRSEATRSFDRFLTLAENEVTWPVTIPEDTLGTFDLTIELIYHVHGSEMTAKFEFPAAILEPLSAPYGINLGGLSNDPEGSVEIEGVEFEAHSEFALPNGSARPIGTFQESAHNREGVEVEGTDHQEIYQTIMFGTGIGYEIDMEPGTYTVGIHVQEIWADGDGERIFSLFVQGVPVFEDLDLHAEVGRRTAYAEYVEVTVEEEEPIVIDTSASVDNSAISAIEIRGEDEDPIAG